MRDLLQNTPFERFNTLDLSPVAHFTVDRRDIILEANLRGAELLGGDMNGIVQKPFARFVAPEDAAKYKEYCRRVFESKKKRVCELSLVKQSGFKASVRLESVVTESGADHADEICIAVFDATEWKVASEELRLFESAVSQMQEAAAIFSAGSGPDDSKIVFVNPAFTRLNGIAASVAMGRTLRLLEGGQAGPAEIRRAYKQLKGGQSVSLVSAQIRGEKSFPAEWHLTPVRDERGDVTHFVGLQFDVTRRIERDRAALDIAEEEQERIARDLHDGLCQNLLGLTFILRAFKGRLEGVSPKEAAEAQQALQMVQEALAQARDLSDSLGSMEEEAGLGGALKNLASYVKKIYGITCHLDLDPVIRVSDPAYAANLYRIAQEALNNSAEHSQAENIWLGLTKKGRKICLTVEDDGLGIRSEIPNDRKGHGLRLMRHRAHLMNAKLEVKRLDGKGTLVRCAVQSENQ